MSRSDLFSLMNESPITLIGYSYSDERVKDELISNFNYIDVGEINSSFSFNSIQRDIKLNYILNDSKLPDYIVIDIGNIRVYDPLMIANKINDIVKKMIDSFDNSINIIITSPVNKSIINDCQTTNFLGGNRALFISHLALVIEDNKAKVMKNRMGFENIIFNLLEE